MITDKTEGNVTDTEAIGLSADVKAALTITVQVPGRDRPNVMRTGVAETLSFCESVVYQKAGVNPSAAGPTAVTGRSGLTAT